MIITVNLVSIYRIKEIEKNFFLVMRTLRIYSQQLLYIIHITLIIFIMLYIISLELIYLITGSLYLLIVHPVPLPPTPRPW